MPSPVGHAIGGLIVGLLSGYGVPGIGFRGIDPGVHHPVPGTRYPVPGTRDPVPGRRFLALCVVAACSPDIDFLWGRHNMETHSVGFALVVGLVVFAWTRSLRVSVACLLAVGTHVLFDWLGSDDFPPLGVMALWTFTSAFYFADAYVFATISHRYQFPGFAEHNPACSSEGDCDPTPLGRLRVVRSPSQRQVRPVSLARRSHALLGMALELVASTGSVTGKPTRYEVTGFA